MDMYKIGGQQLIKFSITLLLTLFLGLIKGIALGMLITMIFHLVASKRAGLILRNLFKPNTLLLSESDGTYVINVRYFSNFLNFSRVKAKLDTIPYQANVVIDFSLADFVDYSTLEHLHQYRDTFLRNGGDLSIVGLDNLQSSSHHPLSPMRPLWGSEKSKPRPLSRRQLKLRSMAAEINWDFESHEFQDVQGFTDFGYFRSRTVDLGRNLLLGSVTGTYNDQTQGLIVKSCDLDYHEGEFIAREPKHATILIIELPVEIPEFIMDKERLLDRVGHLAGFRDIGFANHREFSQRFRLKGEKRFSLRRFFDDSVIHFFETNPLYHIESNGHQLLIFEKDRLATVSEYKIMVNFATRFAELLHDKIEKGYVGT